MKPQSLAVFFMIEQISLVKCYLYKQSITLKKLPDVKNFTQLFLILLLVIPLTGKAIDSIYIRRPAVNQLNRELVIVEVHVYSSSTIDTVKASVGSQTALLTRYSAGEYFGSITFTGMPEGPLQLVIFAKDVTGDTLTATRTFIYDKAPVITVESPLPYASYQSKVHIKATITDPGHTDCTGIISTEDGFSIPFTNSIDTLVDPNPGKDQGSFELNFYGIDSLNEPYPSNVIPLFNDKSSYLVPVYTDSGQILDVDSTRILRAITAGVLISKFKIYNTVTSASSFITLDHLHTQYNSSLLAGLCKGGAFSLQYLYTNKPYHQLYLWRGDTLINITKPLKTSCLETEIKSAGNTLMWTRGDSITAITDLSTLKTTFTSIPKLNQGVQLSADGDKIVYSAGSPGNYNIYSYTVSSQVTTQITTSGNNIVPSIDGNNISYIKVDGTDYLNYLNDGTTDYNLGPTSIYFNPPSRLFGGYMAFEKTGSSDTLYHQQLWLRNPANVLNKMATFSNLYSSLEKLGANGRIIFIDYAASSNYMRYYVDSVTPAVPISGTLGKIYFVRDSFYLALGGTLYGYHIPAIIPPPQISAITPDSAITGNTITIKGLHFTNTSAVSFGGTAATSFTIVSDSVITAVVGTGSSGDVSVTTPVGTATFSGFYFVYYLPAEYYNIINTSATCVGGKDGSISISALIHTNYIVQISGPNIDKAIFLSTRIVIKNLAAGTYSICILPGGSTKNQQCFTSVITEPKPLSAYIAVNQDDRKVTLSLTGATLYHIQLNDTEITTGDSLVTLDLKKGLNKIVVSTEKSCQGIITKDITIGSNLIAYPNPFQKTIHLNLGNETVQKAVITVYNTSGKIIYTRGYSNQSGVLTIDLPDMSDGLYMLKLVANNQETTFKLLKK